MIVTGTTALDVPLSQADQTGTIGVQVDQMFIIMGTTMGEVVRRGDRTELVSVESITGVVAALAQGGKVSTSPLVRQGTVQGFGLTFDWLIERQMDVESGDDLLHPYALASTTDEVGNSPDPRPRSESACQMDCRHAN